jgi:hypothetical protein
MAEGDKLSDVRLYELAIERNNNIEERREDINKYYTSLFTAIVSIMPFINKIPLKECGIEKLIKLDLVNALLGFLAVIALSLSVSWILTLKRIYHNLEAIDEFLIVTEDRHGKRFIGFLYDHLAKVHSPGRVTKNQMVVPYVFISIFLLVLIYSISNLLAAW